jgi:predicted ATP-grasp superfamily ATP-dependent carboligase
MVTGAGGSAGYNVTTCLLHADHFVLGVDTDEHMIHLSPADATSTASRPGWADLVGRFDIDYILPQPEQDVQWLAKQGPHNLPHLLPRSETVELCADKLRLADYLAELAPPSFAYPLGFEPVEELIQRHGGKMWMRARRGAGAYAALPVHNAHEADAWKLWWNTEHDLGTKDFMLSEYLPGQEYTWQGVYRSRILLGDFARERVTPMIKQGFSGTPSVARSSMQASVMGNGREVVRRLKFKNGVIGVDMKCDSGGVLRVTEVNTRFYTTTLFPAALGINLPDALVTGQGTKGSYEEGRFWVRQPDAGYKLV